MTISRARTTIHLFPVSAASAVSGIGGWACVTSEMVTFMLLPGPFCTVIMDYWNGYLVLNAARAHGRRLGLSGSLPISG